MRLKVFELFMRTVGFVGFVIGMAGLGGAIEMGESFLLPAVILAVGIFFSWIDIKYLKQGNF